MRQSNANEFLLNSSFPTIDNHRFQPLRNGHLDVKLPVPNSDIRLFIFNPVDYPYLWVKYLDGLQREYSRMQVDHILEMDTLRDPASTALVMLAIINGEVVSGLRFHGLLRKAEEASVYKEMAEGNAELLKDYLNQWIPEGIVEPKGLWLNTHSPARKRLLHLMARCGIYGAALLDARYSVCTSPKNITRMHINIGMQAMEEIGTVEYPTKDYQTTFGCFDLQSVLDICDDQNRVQLRRDWQQIHFTRLNSPAHQIDDKAWLPLVLDEGNPFHSQMLESLLLDPEYEQRTCYHSMQQELSELLPKADEAMLTETKRWVAYPWRNLAIELLGPKSLKRLRCDRNRNKITDDEQLELAKINVGVVGLSTGHVIAHTLVMEGACGALKLADFDTLEVSNLNRIPASLVDIGVNKAVIAARRIAELDPYVNVELFQEGLTDTNIERFMQGLDIVIEECDSLDVKVLVREAAIRRKIPVLMATSDHGMMDVERFDLEPQAKPFHGLTDVSAHMLKDLSRRDKSGYALAIVEGEKISARLAASMIEIDHTVKTWSQLASDVTQGAAMVTTAVRRIGTGKTTPSSRTRMDMDRLFEEGKKPVLAPTRSLDMRATETPQFTGDTQADMLLAARFAPSPGNIQPWKMHWKKDQMQFEVNRELTTSMDIKWRGAMVSLGAACLNAEIVAAKQGQRGRLAIFPDAKKEDLVATFSCDKQTKADSALTLLYPNVLSRETNRELSARQAISAEALNCLGEVTNLYPVSLHTLSSPEKLAQYAEIAVESDRIRHLCPHLHQEMMRELIWPGKDVLEQGIDVRTLGLKEKDLNVLPILSRSDVMGELASWGGGTALGEYNKERINNASAMVVICAKGQSEADYVMAGKALQHFWLLAEQQGLVVQPVSPVFLYANNDDDIQELMRGEYLPEVAGLRKQFDQLLNVSENDYPIIVLRLTYADRSMYRSLRRFID